MRLIVNYAINAIWSRLALLISISSIILLTFKYSCNMSICSEPGKKWPKVNKVIYWTWIVNKHKKLETACSATLVKVFRPNWQLLRSILLNSNDILLTLRIVIYLYSLLKRRNLEISLNVCADLSHTQVTLLEPNQIHTEIAFDWGVLIWH